MKGYPRKELKFRKVLSRKRPECGTDVFRKGTDLILLKAYPVKPPSSQSRENSCLLELAEKLKSLCSRKVSILFLFQQEAVDAPSIAQEQLRAEKGLKN